MSLTHGGPLWCKLTLKVRHARCQVTYINCDRIAANTLRSLNVFPCSLALLRGEVLYVPFLAGKTVTRRASCWVAVVYYNQFSSFFEQLETYWVLANTPNFSSDHRLIRSL